MTYLKKKVPGSRISHTNMLAEIGHGIELLDLAILNIALREINILLLGGAPL